ncbi:MAG: leucine-rich repeat domain-containing protein, partial [Verrucomicrobiota bacterium]
MDKINPNTKSSLETLEEWVKAAPAGEDRIAAQKKIQEFLETSICKKIFYLFLSQSSILDLTSLLLTSLPNIFNDPCFNKLKILKLYNNQLETLPESFGNLQALQTLNLFNNQLRALPESIGNLQALQTLKLQNNQLETLPESFGNLQALQTLNLFNNQLRALPESIGNLQALQ